MINVTGVKSGGASAKLALHEGDQFLIERIAGPAEQTLSMPARWFGMKAVAGRSASRPLLKPTSTRQARATVSSMPHSKSSAAQQQLPALITRETIAAAPAKDRWERRTCGR